MMALPRTILRSCPSLPRRASPSLRHSLRALSTTASPAAVLAAAPANHTEGLEVPSLNTTYAYRWLRDACTCPTCIHPFTQQKRHRTSDIPASIAPESVEISADGVHISWAGADRHRSFFPQALLAAHASPTALHSFHKDVPVALWSTASALHKASGSDLEVPYEDLATPRGLLRAITQLQRTGILFLRNVPSEDSSDAGCEVRKMVEYFAEIRGTFYGDVWNVKTVDEEIPNIAYTNLFLGLHMDLQYFECPPRFQILHCLRNRVHGGKSLFVDAFAAAETLRTSHPEDFARLATTPVPFHYINATRHLHNARPTFTLDSASGGAEPRVTAVSYSPPFQAPLHRDTPPEFYDALARYAELVEAPSAVYSFQLSEGDAVIFDNRRMLHGRTAFQSRESADAGAGAGGGHRDASGQANRWLKGCYFEGDIMASRARILREKAARGEI